MKASPLFLFMESNYITKRLHFLARSLPYFINEENDGKINTNFSIWFAILCVNIRILHSVSPGESLLKQNINRRKFSSRILKPGRRV